MIRGLAGPFPGGRGDDGAGAMGYRYPDPRDLIPRSGIEPVRVIDGAGWDEADQVMVQRAAALLPAGRAGSCADVGAGRGRLLPALLELADQVTVIEPDPGRLAGARGRAGRGRARCRFLDADLATAQLGGARFDLVVCSHVLQHLATGQRADFTAALHGVTAPGGLLVLMCPGTLRGPGRLLLSERGPAPAGVSTREASAADFDEAAGPARPGGQPGPLPVWHAGAGDVEALLTRAGMTVVSRACYREFRFPLIDAAGRAGIGSAADVCIIASPHRDRSG